MGMRNEQKDEQEGRLEDGDGVATFDDNDEKDKGTECGPDPEETAEKELMDGVLERRHNLPRSPFCNTIQTWNYY